MNTLMHPSQALALAACLVDYEIEEPQIRPCPPEWLRELREARLILGALLSIFEHMPARRPLPIDWQNLPEELSTTEAARVLDMQHPSISRMIREGRIPATREGRAYRIRRDELRQALESGRLSAPKVRQRARPDRLSHPELGF